MPAVFIENEPTPAAPRLTAPAVTGGSLTDETVRDRTRRHVESVAPSRDDTATRTGPSRDDAATRICPVCQRPFTATGRQTYCGSPCRKTAFRRRHQQPLAAVTVPAARPRRDYTIYECLSCGDRLLGEQRCPTCGIFARRIDVGGPCPHCDQPVALSDLLDQDVIPVLTNK